jgi:RHS repeat-associated protein
LRFPGQINYGYAGIYYNYNRDYDSNMGRYLESDPIGLVAGNNTYSYGFNNPLVYIDPYGLHCLSPEVIRGLAGALEGGVSGIPLGWGALAYAAFGAVAGYASAADFPTYSTSGFIPAGVAGAASSLKSGGSGAIGGLVGGLAGGASAEFFGIPIRAPWKNAITAAKNGSVFGLFGGLAGSGLERYLLSTRDKDCDDQGCIQ